MISSKKLFYGNSRNNAQTLNKTKGYEGTLQNYPVPLERGARKNVFF